MCWKRYCPVDWMSLAELMASVASRPFSLKKKKKKTFLFCVNCHYDVCLLLERRKKKRKRQEICAPFGKMNERDTDERHAVEPSADCVPKLRRHGKSVLKDPSMRNERNNNSNNNNNTTIVV
jgi:hypothetical protein